MFSRMGVRAGLMLIGLMGMVAGGIRPGLSAAEPEAKVAPVPAGLDLAVIKTGIRQGTAQGLWNRDKHYKDLEELLPHTAVTIADLKGPAVITLFRISKTKPNPAWPRGIVLEIYFDEAPEPAVMCPVADFFGDGCNGRGMDFASRFVEVVPAAYNAYFPMPFKTAAKVRLRNDTDAKFFGYAYVEWESLPAWKSDLGYFHATWRRKAFQLTDETRETFFHVEGRGHVVGRQFSIATDDPRFADFHFVMEGNNEIDVDGRPRVIEYLGSEDSFTFSWGFQRPFIGPHAGMPLVTKTRLSIYRFHDPMPIRFEKELTWSIDWTNEVFGKQSGWVDYATVFYWYQDSPAGFRHEPLPPVADRMAEVLAPPPEKAPS